jgi:NAD(P)H dehydrogenase (quinone)
MMSFSAKRGSTANAAVPTVTNGYQMHVLLVYCHPRTDSFCSALRDTATSALRAANHIVEVRDLYAEGFVPAMSADERGRYYCTSPNLDGIEQHISALRGADGLLLVYPSWWFGLPAMLKGWFDRIWVPGVAFRFRTARGLEPLLTNIRRLGVVTTYGSPRWFLWFIGWPDRRMVNSAFRSLCARGVPSGLDCIDKHGHLHRGATTAISRQSEQPSLPVAVAAQGSQERPGGRGHGADIFRAIRRCIGNIGNKSVNSKI